MPRERSDTKAGIRAVALELFGLKGYEKTSLREIAERLDLTKAALYYHFPSKGELLRSLVEPLRLDAEDLVRRFGDGVNDPGEALGAYFDLCVRHGSLMRALLNDLGSLNEVGLVDLIMDWRRRLDAALVGEEPTIPARMGAVVALGGIQDVAVMFPREEAAAHRETAVAIALAALSAGAAPMD